MAAVQRLGLYARLVRLDRPIGILLLLWPTLWALWIASAGHPSPRVLIVFVIGTALMRSAGCAINDYADRDFDRHVKRTESRPLTSGQISVGEALAVALVLTVLAALLLFALNRLTFMLALVAAFIAATYPFTKRFFALPQAYLGVAFGFGIPMAFAAVEGTVPRVGWLLLVANVFWAVAYDTEYAMVDRDDDLRIGIRTAAITFGRWDVAAIMACYGCTLLLLAWAGQLVGRGWPYRIGLVVAAGIALYHGSLIRTRRREDCFRAFLHNNWFGFVVFAGLFADYALGA